jgi:basic membrane protein A
MFSELFIISKRNLEGEEMKKSIYLVVIMLLALSMVLASCQTDAPAVEEQTSDVEEAVVEEVAEEAAEGDETDVEYVGKVCVVLDSGGVDDKGYNQTAWEGAQTAAADLNWEATYLESAQLTDYEKNINEFLQSDCTVIVAVGFLPGDAVQKAATENPDQKFAILDYAYDPVIPNVWAHLYNMPQGAFLAGYLAAGTTETGKVGAFGGMNIPPVADFFIGFTEGIEYYNEVHGTSVEMLGWSNETLDGLFVGDFNDTDTARLYTQNLLDEGVDIVLPQSGAEALASAALVKEVGDVLCIGADSDQNQADAQSGDVYLTSIRKQVDISIGQIINAVADGSFTGGTYFGDLSDGTVNLAPYHNHAEKVSAELQAELDEINKKIISGEIVVSSWASLSSAE